MIQVIERHEQLKSASKGLFVLKRLKREQVYFDDFSRMGVDLAAQLTGKNKFDLLKGKLICA